MQRMASGPFTNKLNIGLAGFGVVGGGVVSLLSSHDGIVFKKIVMRDVNKKRDVAIPDGCEIVSSWQSLVDDTNIDLIIEVMGGVDDAKDLTFAAIKADKHIITANKALLSKHLDDIVELQHQHPTCYILYEAAVCGGIPIISTLTRGCSYDKIQRVVGIMNGTTNYILTEMEHDATKTYPVVLKDAKDKGYAEADPSADVEGWDARSKLCLLAKLSFGLTIDEDAIYCKGISSITSVDFKHATMLGLSMKLLGVAEVNSDHKVSIYVSPCLVNKNNPIAKVEGVTNVVEVISENIGPAYYIGAGAGRWPTANSIVADVLDLYSRLQHTKGANAPPPFPLQKAAVTYESDYETTFYIRFVVEDKMGVVHAVSGLMAEYGLSIYSMLQAPVESPTNVPFSIITDKARLSSVKKFCEALSAGKSDKYKWLCEEPFFVPYLR